jgi:hypothetical protein
LDWNGIPIPNTNMLIFSISIISHEFRFNNKKKSKLQIIGKVW